MRGRGNDREMELTDEVERARREGDEARADVQRLERAVKETRMEAEARVKALKQEIEEQRINKGEDKFKEEVSE